MSIYAGSDNVYAQSGLIAFDLFSYTKGNMLNTCGGAQNGWSGNWMSSDPEAKALNTTPLSYSTIGPGGAYAQFKQVISRQFSGNIDATSSPVWLSMLARGEQGATGYYTITLYNAEAGVLFYARQKGGDAEPYWELGGGGSPTVSSGKGIW